MELTSASSHSPPQWRGWASPRELAEQRRGVIPRRVVAQCQSLKCLYPRVGAGTPVKGASSEAGPARGRCLIGPLWWATGATAAWATLCVRA
jgi:hypothetical protein